MTDIAATIHRAVEALKFIDATERDAYLKRGEVLTALKSLKPWKGAGYNGAKTWSQFCAGVLGIKQSSADLCIKATARFGPLSIAENIPAIPSRMEKVLSIKTANQDEEIELLHRCADILPHKAFIAFLRESKGKPHAETCDHVGHGVETWHKCKNCGTWTKEV